MNVNVSLEVVERLNKKNGNPYLVSEILIVCPFGRFVIEDFSLKGFEKGYSVSFNDTIVKDDKGRFSLIKMGYFIPWQYNFCVGMLYDKYVEKGEVS